MNLFIAKLRNGGIMEARFQLSSKKIMFLANDCVSEWHIDKVGINMQAMVNYYSIQIFAGEGHYIRFNCTPESYLDARNFFIRLGFPLPDTPAQWEAVKRV